MAKTNEKTLAGPGGQSLVVEYRDPKSLKPYARNAKTHPADQIQSIAAQISAFGFDQPIVILKDGTIVKGHGRREAAILLSLKKIPCVVTKLSDAQAAAARIGDNKVAESPWMTDVLRLEFDYIKDQGFDVELTGFRREEHAAISEGWSAAPQKGEPDGDDPGLMARVSITCKQSDRERVITAIEGALRAAGIAETKIS